MSKLRKQSGCTQHQHRPMDRQYRDYQYYHQSDWWEFCSAFVETNDHSRESCHVVPMIGRCFVRYVHVYKKFPRWLSYQHHEGHSGDAAGSGGRNCRLDFHFDYCRFCCCTHLSSSGRTEKKLDQRCCCNTCCCTKGGGASDHQRRGN